MDKKEKEQAASFLYEKSSGNVFADLGLPDPELEDMKVQLSLKIFQIIKRRKLTHAKLALLLGVEPPEISKLKNGLYHRFSVKRLSCFLNRLNEDVDINLDFYKT